VGQAPQRLTLQGGNVAGVPSAARQNLADAASFEARPFAAGSFRLCYRGVYANGARAGQQCVKKVFIAGSVYEDEHFDAEMEVVARTLDVLTQFNGAGFVSRRIRLNKPEVWRDDTTGERYVVEPFVQGFQKFNSNSGYVCEGSDDSWPALMQALSHYSYHITAGSLLLCDLQGGVYADGAVLTDPVVMSMSGRFGPTDLGRDGIITFFSQHECGEYCSREWTRPRERAVLISPTPHTCMRRTGPTAPRGVPFMTGGGLGVGVGGGGGGGGGAGYGGGYGGRYGGGGRSRSRSRERR
jgi:hypothetical protein